MNEIVEQDYWKLMKAIAVFGKSNELDCGTPVPWAICHIDGENYTMKYYCKDRIGCDICAGRYGSKRLKVMRQYKLEHKEPSWNTNYLFADFWEQVENPRDNRLLFATLTLPGAGTKIRHANLRVQVFMIKRMFKMLCDYWDAMEMPITGYMKLETTRNRSKRWWNTHIHIAYIHPRGLEWCDNDLRDYSMMFKESVQLAGFGPQIGPNELVEECENIGYLGKYFAKGMKEMTKWELDQVTDVMKNEQILRLFGKDRYKLPKTQGDFAFMVTDDGIDYMIEQDVAPMDDWWM